MKKVVIERPGGYNQLQLKEFPNLQPGAGEILIEVKAAGVNFADCVIRMGVYKSAKEFVGWPITPGFEIAGIVKELGSGVAGFAVGDKVAALTLFNGYATQICLSPEQVFKLPPSFDLQAAAAIPAVFLTAYYALYELAHPLPESTILVHSAAGGVGSALVQLGKLAGCRVAGVVGASHKVQYVKELGADLVIDKSKEPLWTAAERFSSKGFDVILDANGVETLQESYNHLGLGGKLIIYGFHTMFSKGAGRLNWIKLIWDYFKTPRFNPLEMTNDNRSVMAFNLSYMFQKKEVLLKAMQQLFLWFKEGKLKLPKVTAYPLEQVAEAHKALESGNSIGKLVLTNRLLE